MTINEAIKQLEDLRQNQETFIDGKDPEPDNPFVLDMAAIDVALKIIGSVNDMLTRIAETKVQMLADRDENIFKYSYYTGYCSALSEIEGVFAAFTGD